MTMIKRIITSIIGIVVFFAVFFAPRWVFAAALALITLVAVYEVTNVITRDIPTRITALAASALLCAAVMTDRLFPVLTVISAAYFILSVVRFSSESIKNIYTSGFVSVILTLLFSSISLLRRESELYMVLFPFLFAWITDSGAYFAGSLFGKHKLAPQLSPKKTVEGAVGGIVCCMVCTAAYMLILNYALDIPFGLDALLPTVGVSAAASVVSQFGDLAASAIKREYGVKDYGSILPGHGGIMDRFDSVILAAPVWLFFLTLI